LDPYLTFKLAVLFFLFVVSGFFASAEASLFSLTPLHLHKIRGEESPRLSTIRELLRYPRRLLITIIACNESVNIMISSLTAVIFINLFGDQGKWTAIAVLTPLFLVFCEAVPKTVAKTNPIAISQAVSPLLVLFFRLLLPVSWVLDKVSGWLTGPFQPSEPLGKDELTEGELRVLVDVGHEEGVLQKPHRDLIHRVFELADTTVEEIMTPRIDMFCLPVSLTLDEMKKEILRSGYSRVPVYGMDRDDILGILYAKDLLLAMASGRWEADARELLRKPYFVPMEKEADSLLKDFQVRKIHMAIVVDEYGGVAGLVTMEDILESLFGDIYDERDIKERYYRVLDGQTLVASGRMPIEEFNALTGMNIPSEDFDTVGGFVLHLFGRLPSRGEDVRYDGAVFRVERMRGASIWRVRVTREEVKE